MAESKVEELARIFAETKDNQAFARFMEELEKSTVFVPAQPSDEMAAKIKAAAAAGQAVPVAKEEAPNICLLTQGDGSMVFPIFLSREQVPKEKQPPALLNMPFKAVINIVKGNMTKVKSIAVNPFTQGIILNENLIDLADRRFKAKDANAAGGQTVQLTEKQFHAIAHVKVASEAIPKALFGDAEGFMSDLRIKKEKCIDDIYRAVYPKELRCPYTEDDYAVMMLQIEDDLVVTRIDLPEENKQLGGPLRVYITQNGTEYDYFIIEKGENKIDRIVRITKDGKRTEVMDAPDNGVEIETIMSLIKPS